MVIITLSCLSVSMAGNGLAVWCRFALHTFSTTTAVTGKLHYTACCVSGAGLTDKFD